MAKWGFNKYGFGPQNLAKKYDEILFGKKGKNKQLTLQTPEQQELLKLIYEGLSSGEGPLKDIFGGFNAEEFEKGVSQPALKNFQENVLPQLQEKYIANNQFGSSGRRRAELRAGTDLQSNLAQLMYQAQQQGKQNKLQGLNTALGTKAFENLYKPGTEGLLHGAAKGFAQGAGNAAGAAIAG